MGGYGSSYSYATDNAVVKKSAKAYNIDAQREYSENKAIVPPPRGKVLVTRAKFPLVVLVDVTGSMREYPAIIFEKLCILYNEVRFFLPDGLKDTFEISFAAVGDAYSDSAPLQVTDFASGAELDMNIKSLYPEGGGGGQSRETYELAAYYYTNKCNLLGSLEHPKPVLIFVGDEGYYSKINRQHVKDLIGDDLPSDLIATDVFAALKDKFSVYALRIEYSHEDKEAIIDSQWRDTLGPGKVILMEDPKRIVDTIIGIVAAEVDGFDKFKERIEIRQTPEQVKQVYASLDGVETGNKKYVYEIRALECPKCLAMLPAPPDYGKPVACKSCGYLIIRI